MASILIIEDEAALRRMMAVFVLDAGFEVATANSPEAALERVARYLPDVIVFNTFIEDEAKRHCIRELHERSPRSKVLDVSTEKNRLVRGIIDSPPDGDGALPGEVPTAHLQAKAPGTDGVKPSLDGASSDGGTNAASGMQPTTPQMVDGAHGVLLLPFEASALVASVRALLAQSSKEAAAQTKR